MDDQGKRRELAGIAKDGVLRGAARRSLWPRKLRPSLVSDEAAEKIGLLAVDNFATITAPEHSLFVGLMMVGQGGTGGGSTTKPGNIFLNWKKLIVEGSASALTAVGAIKVPFLVPLAALVIWNRLWSTLKIDLSERHAAVIYAMWIHRSKENIADGPRILEFVNAELAQYDRRAMTRRELARLLADLERMQCIELKDGDWWLREWVRVSYG